MAEIAGQHAQLCQLVQVCAVTVADGPDSFDSGGQHQDRELDPIARKPKERLPCQRLVPKKKTAEHRFMKSNLMMLFKDSTIDRFN